MSETPKERLVGALVAHLEHHGLADTSLRAMATAVGSSHRMLLYHFGSREGLLVEVSRAVERRQREGFEAMLADASMTPRQVMWAMYAQVADPALHPAERLFFELYVRALLDPGASTFLPEVVEAWLPPLTRLFTRLGLDDDAARVEARLSLATSRGMLLDLLATADRAAVDEAMAHYMRRFDGCSPNPPRQFGVAASCRRAPPT